MPIPKPRKNETEADFKGRCMADPTMVREYDNNQRFAICASQWSDRNMNIKIKNALNNYSIRRAVHQGREHLVVPATVMVEGVHCGSRGCLFYSTDVLANFAHQWNGAQVLIGHPDNGGFCNDPEIMDNQSTGQAFNFHMVGNRLKCEFWIDAQRLIELNNELYNDIINTRPVEVSTGLGIGNMGDGGVWNGEEYVGAVLDMQPDHIAILPNAIGACSIQDGCGIRNKEEEREGENVMDGEADVEKVVDEKESRASNMLEKVSDMFSGIFNRKKHCQCNEMSLTDLHAKMVAHLDSMDDDMKRFYLVELFNDRVVYKIRPGPMAHSGTQPVMFQAEYSVDDNGMIELGEPKQVVQETSYRVIENDEDINNGVNNDGVNNDSVISTNTKNKGGEELMDEKEKKEMIDGLIACNHTQWAEGDREQLDGLEDEVISKLSVVNIECGDGAGDGGDDNNNESNDDTGNKVENTDGNSTVEDVVSKLSPEHQQALNEALRVANKRKEEIIACIKNADGNKFTDDDLKTRSIEELENIAALIPEKSGNDSKPSYAVNAGRHMHVINDGDNDGPLAVVNGFDALVEDKK